MFVHLHCHSHYSFLRAVPSPEEIVAAAAEQKMQAVALTDTNGLYAAVPFYLAAREAGIKPIVGTILDVGAGLGPPRARQASPLHADDTRRGAAPVPSGAEGCCARVPLLLLAENFAGYSNLCRLVTRRQLGDRPVTLQALNKHREGLIALYAPGKSENRSRGLGTNNDIRRGAAPVPSGAEGCCAPEIRQRDAGGTTEAGRVARLKEIFGDALYLEVQHFPGGAAPKVRGSAPTSPSSNLREALRLGRELGVPIVATNNVHFLRPAEHLHHRVLNAIRTGTLLTKIAPPEITSAEAYFKPAEEMRRAFPDHPEALRATLEIAERSNLELPLGKTIFPEFPVPEGETPFSYLWKLCFEGARQRYKPVRPEVLSRLVHELEVIHKLNLAPYFLLVWDIVTEAQRRGIPAVARGSAASSIVTYCLGISRVCPLRWGLYFERFLNEQRGDVPDIDLDICGARRDALLDYVYKRWGAEHVAMIASFITMHARLAVREVAKVFGLSPAEVNYFTRRLPHRPVREILEAIRTLPECRQLPAREEPWKTVLEVALRLDGFPRHLGIHPCGTVIAAQPLTRLLPLEVATKGIVVTQYDMNAVEALGLVKMDLLGQRGLTTMSLALDNIQQAIVGAPAACPACPERSRGERSRRVAGCALHLFSLGGRSGIQPDEVGSSDIRSPKRMGFRDFRVPHSLREAPEGLERTGKSACAAGWIDFDAIPEGDPATCAMISCGRTMGIFQIESPGMRGLLRTLQARTLEDVCLALALIRPGASEYGAKETFLKRLRKQEPVRYPHACLESILKETLGVCVYQEQVMQIAQAVGTLTLAEADLVRRSLAKFSDQRERDRLRAKFLKAAERIGLAGAERDDTWQMVEKFAGFGFCKAHAATYADLSYRIAYLKAHYPAEFLAAMASSGAGFYHVSAYVEEAKRWGIPVLLPSVNASRLEYTVEACGDDANPPRAIRIGLMQVKGLCLETIETLVASRDREGPYRSLENFLARVPVERDEIESLIKCGAFDEVGDPPRLTRPALLWRLNLVGPRRKPALPPAPGLPFPASDAPPEAASAAPLAAARLAADYTREQRLRYEQEILEVCVSGHPLDLVPRNGELWSTELEKHRGRRVTLLGWLITFRHVGTKDYRNMMFATLEDQRGTFEAVLFPEAYQRYGGLIFETRALRVTGRVEQTGQINCEKLESAIRDR